MKRARMTASNSLIAASPTTVYIADSTLVNLYEVVSDDMIPLSDADPEQSNFGFSRTVPELMLRQALLQSYFLYFYKQGIKSNDHDENGTSPS